MSVVSVSDFPGYGGGGGRVVGLGVATGVCVVGRVRPRECGGTGGGGRLS